MIGTIVALVVALAVLCGGLYYLAKEKKDKESRKIYGIVSTIGAVALSSSSSRSSSQASKPQMARPGNFPRRAFAFERGF